jgi:hypothetical protein
VSDITFVPRCRPHGSLQSNSMAEDYVRANVPPKALLCSSALRDVQDIA